MTRRQTHYSRFEPELPAIGSFATTRDGHYGQVIAHEDGQMRLQFAGSIQGLYAPDEVTINKAAANCPHCGHSGHGERKCGAWTRGIPEHPCECKGSAAKESKWQTAGTPLSLAAHDYPELEGILNEPAPAISQQTQDSGRVSVWGSKTATTQYGDQFWSEVDHKWYDVREPSGGDGRFVVVADGEGRYAVADTQSRECSGSMSRADAESAAVRWSQNPNLAPFDDTWKNDYSGLFDNLKSSSKTAARHLTLTGPYAGQTLCGAPSGQGDDNVHAAYCREETLSDPNTCAACRAIWSTGDPDADPTKAPDSRQNKMFGSKAANRPFDPNAKWCEGTGQALSSEGPLAPAFGCPHCYSSSPPLTASGTIQAHNPVTSDGQADSPSLQSLPRFEMPGPMHLVTDNGR
jgi:hypothetical protein